MTPSRRVLPERPDRRQNILLAAEKLFAQRGYAAVSIRNIAEEAGVPLALVGYYFGQKHELYHAIFERWSATIEERLAGLRAAVALGSQNGDALHRIVEAFIAPVIRLRASAEGEYYALLMTRGLSLQAGEEDDVIRTFFDPMAHAFIEALQGALSAEFPTVTRGTVAWCYQFGLGALLHHVGDQRVRRLSGGKNCPSDPAAMPLLVAFITEGMRGAVRVAHGGADLRPGKHLAEKLARAPQARQRADRQTN